MINCIRREHRQRLVRFPFVRKNLTEVNFWWPGETNFRALQPGEILAFRPKSPRNKIGGFGIFSNHCRLPIQMAWETFGRANGVSSLEGLRSAIAQLRTNITVLPSTDIGSTILVQPVFFPSYLWFDVPASWISEYSARKALFDRDCGRSSNSGIGFGNCELCKAPIFHRNQCLEFDDMKQARFGSPI